MGCTSSKLEDLPAVALCRDRLAFLEEAIQLRFDLAQAYVAYIHSLREIGHPLHHFIHQQGSDFPELNLSTERKGGWNHEVETDSPKKVKPVITHNHSRSNSGSVSQLHFTTDSEDENGSDGLRPLHLSGHSPPLHHPLHLDGLDADRYLGHVDYTDPVCMGIHEKVGQHPSGGFVRMDYMTNKPTPPWFVHHQNPEGVFYVGESSSSSTSSCYPYPYPNFGYQNYNYGSGGGTIPSVSLSKAPPPPSPPRASAWDCLNPFESYDKYYPADTQSRGPRELRKEEIVPDSEGESDRQHEIVKEVREDHRFVESKYSKSAINEDDDKAGADADADASGSGGDVEASLYQKRPIISLNSERVEYELHVVEKKVKGNERSAADRVGARNISEVAKEIELQFGRASESANEIAKMLEVGKIPYKHKHVFAKMLHVVSPSLLVSSQPSTPKTLEFEEEVAMRSGNLSSTLQKLYLWEKKLYNEVKAEEKMRVVHDKMVHKLKRLDEPGTETHKVESTRTLIWNLSTKIRMGIQVIDKISVTINKIRDNELWPQLNELIQGLAKMWKCMLECHNCQCQTVKEASGLGLIHSCKKLSDAHLEATRQLEHELVNWTVRFSYWINAQKGYVKALNNWLLKSLLYEPEETPDGIASFSPSRIGAPPVFVICNQWSRAMERISEKEVIDSMRIFTMSVLRVWGQDTVEMRQRMIGDKDLERKVRDLDREEENIQKKIRELEKKIVLTSVDAVNSLLVYGNVVYHGDSSSSSLKGGLERTFETMERFSADSMKAYEELLQRTEDEKQRVL